MLQWLTNNQQPNTSYEVQISTDGKTFSNPDRRKVTLLQQVLLQNTNINTTLIHKGKLYFRIEQTDATGKISFSEIVVGPQGNAAGTDEISYHTFS